MFDAMTAKRAGGAAHALNSLARRGGVHRRIGATSCGPEDRRFLTAAGRLEKRPSFDPRCQLGDALLRRRHAARFGGRTNTIQTENVVRKNCGLVSSVGRTRRARDEMPIETKQMGSRLFVLLKTGARRNGTVCKWICPKLTKFLRSSRARPWTRLSALTGI